MELVLTKKLKSGCTVVEGSPGIGLVGTIATEFLIRHLKAEEIGYIRGEDVPPMVAIHDNKVVKPMGIYYSQKHNLVIFHFISGSLGAEWKLSDMMLDFANKFKAREIVSLESVAVPGPVVGGGSKTYFYTNNAAASKNLKKQNVDELKEGIVMGMTSILIATTNIPITCFFGETHSKLPDSNAAAGLLDVLNAYLDLKLDTKPLRKSAEEFEKKIRMMVASTAKAQQKDQSEQLSYLG